VINLLSFTYIFPLFKGIIKEVYKCRLRKEDRINQQLTERNYISPLKQVRK